MANQTPFPHPPLQKMPSGALQPLRLILGVTSLKKYPERAAFLARKKRAVAASLLLAFLLAGSTKKAVEQPLHRNAVIDVHE